MAQRIDRAASFGQNLYVDTRGAAGEPVPFTQAVINGLAQGGGLYVPEELPTLSLDEICALARLPYAQRAAAIYKAFNVDLPDEAIDELMGRAYGDNFDDEAICPITSLDESTHILELWHGPTSAFKDMALQCLPHFFSASAEKLREEGTLDHEFMILVATSGDTGKAALEGFKGVDGVSIGVLFPDGGVSDIQRKQMVTTTGDNVQVWAVRGNFDDCQTGVKRTFADEKFTEKLLNEYRIALSSANSINWGGCCLRWSITSPAMPNSWLRARSKPDVPSTCAFPRATSATFWPLGTPSKSVCPSNGCCAPATTTACSPTSSTPAPTTSPTASSFSPPLPRWTFSSPPTSSASSSN